MLVYFSSRLIYYHDHICGNTVMLYNRILRDPSALPLMLLLLSASLFVDKTHTLVPWLLLSLFYRLTTTCDQHGVKTVLLDSPIELRYFSVAF